MGFVDRRKVLKAVRKTGKRAEFWQEAFTNLYHLATSTINNFTSSQNYYSSYNSLSSSSIGDHMSRIQPFRPTYNYKKHGYNNYDYSTDDSLPYIYHQEGRTSHAAPSIFSDEDPNSCSIM
ncbi:hypothetical protein GOP47_0010890 [Adiantum capillus-veneris]|uniref:Uncharacterized protein n=1 Tax=Adiantum capillus-veneris TaxID=13818 RepID=A0A9D4UVT2_ADICA|nr:hypothetical protein GOP47_0010890 [Adiantum capillus-veneris]